MPESISSCLPEHLHPISRMFLDIWLAGDLSTAEFLQPDIKTRYEAAQIAIAAGFKTIDEVRAEEGLPA